MPPPPQTTAGGSTFDKSKSDSIGKRQDLRDVADMKQ
jgi:hypothetical protein